MKFPRISPDLNAVHQAHSAEMNCDHSHTEVRKKISASNAVLVRAQCLRCGSPVGPPIKKAQYSSDGLLALPSWDPDIQRTYWSQHSNSYTEKRRKEEQRAYSEWLRYYNAYLRTDEWKQKRRLVILRAQGICEGCRCERASEVHHLTYDHVGEEFLFELVALCDACHKRFHASPRFQVPIPSSIEPTEVSNEVA